MRVVGYVRESQGLAESETAFAQGERIRRWVAEHGHHLVAVCRDTREPAGPSSREGYRALLHIVRSGDAEAVVVAELAVLSSDKVLQEIMIHDIRSWGVAVISTDVRELEDLAEPPADATRMVVRDVLARAGAYLDEFARTTPPAVVTELPQPDVVVELVTDQPGGLPPRSGDPGTSAAQTARPSA